MPLTKPRLGYKPFEFPWAFELYKKQQSAHWLPEEVPLADDVYDWKHNLTEVEKNLITQIFRFFTQADSLVEDAYIDNYLPFFKPTEIRMMLTAFAVSEANHINSYSYLLDTIGFPETEYKVFMEYEEMRNKHELLQSCVMDTPKNVALTLATFSAFTEGLQLFSSFAILLNFQRFGKLKGMGQIVTWSNQDEATHTSGMIKVFHTYLKEVGLTPKDIQEEVTERCKIMVEMEFKFIDLAFSMGDVEGLKAKEVKEYVMFLADLRLSQLGMDTIFNITKNPLPYMEGIFGDNDFTNFFEARVTQYSKAATKGNWEEAFDDFE